MYFFLVVIPVLVPCASSLDNTSRVEAMLSVLSDQSAGGLGTGFSPNEPNRI